ncbi:MAG: hypothetical protein JW982_07345 [Spirochaetes bacterium]|nr:hypothetical protein [Spirochaetota bacterium]
MTYLLILIFVTILAAMIYLIRYGEKNTESVIEIPIDSPRKKLPCILCGSYLLKTEKLKSEEYKSETDSLVKVFGCPYCYGPLAVKPRRCPVCKKVLKDGQYLSGRMFYRNDKKPHLHINGCQNCRGK